MLPEKDFDRRDFIWTALGASAALALSGRRRRGNQHRFRGARRGRRVDPDPDRESARLPRDARQGRAVSRGAGCGRDLRPQSLHQGCLSQARQGRALRDRARSLHAQGRSDEDHDDGRDHADREHQIGQRARLRLRRDRRIRAARAARATSHGWASPDSVAADARRSSMPQPTMPEGGRRVVRTRSAEPSTSTRRRPRWIWWARSSRPCSASTARRTQASRGDRSRNSSRR